MGWTWYRLQLTTCHLFSQTPVMGNRHTQGSPSGYGTVADRGEWRALLGVRPQRRPWYPGILVSIVVGSMPLVTGLHHYNLVAERQLLDDLREFYTTIVGLTPGPRPPFKRFGYWLYAGQQDVLHLTEALPSEHRRENRESTFDHVAFSCSDFLSVTARLKTYNVEHHIDDVPLTGQRQYS